MSQQWFEMLEVVFSLSDQLSESHGSIQGTEALTSAPSVNRLEQQLAWAHLGVMHSLLPMVITCPSLCLNS